MVMPRWPAMKTSWRKKASRSCGRTYEEGQKEKTTHETTRSHTYRAWEQVRWRCSGGDAAEMRRGNDAELRRPRVPRAHLRHAQLVAAQPHVPVAFVAVGVDDGAVAVDVLVHEGQRIEHAPHQRLEPRGVRRYAKGAADRVVRLHDLRARGGALRRGALRPAEARGRLSCLAAAREVAIPARSA